MCHGRNRVLGRQDRSQGFLIRERTFWGTGVAQSRKHPILGFCSGYDLRVIDRAPVLGSALSMRSA